MSDGDWAGSDLTPAEVPVGTDVVRQLVFEQFPDWADLPLRPVATPGMDNMTFRLGETMSVRLPRYPRWRRQVLREQKWLPVLGPQLPLAIPVPLAQGEPGAGYPFEWSVYRWLAGEPATPDRFTDRRDAALTLARFLRTLHSLDAAAGTPPEGSNGFRGCDLADPRDSPVTSDRITAKIAALDGLADTDALHALWQAGLSADRWPAAPVWVHGDPAPNNLLAEGGRLTAVIDFGTMAVGDPACDLIAAWTFVGAADRDEFRESIGLDDASWERGRVWGMVATLPGPDELRDPAQQPAAQRAIDELLGDFARAGR